MKYTESQAKGYLYRDGRGWIVPEGDTQGLQGCRLCRFTVVHFITIELHIDKHSVWFFFFQCSVRNKRIQNTRVLQDLKVYSCGVRVYKDCCRPFLFRFIMLGFIWFDPRQSNSSLLMAVQR